MTDTSPHSFHIPVLGLCFSIDTPLKVGRYGISSVVSIIEDKLLEDLRSFYSLRHGVAFQPVTENEEDYRARRITLYLDLVQDLLSQQVETLKKEPFVPGSDLVKYFLLLPESHPLKQQFVYMSQLPEGGEKRTLQDQLRNAVVPGAIDVNIMAKVDNARYSKSGERLPDEYSDALSALRGFANSRLSSSIVFSAGYNPKLYGYAERFGDFFPDGTGRLRKKIILKVSDYRSALVQGKILAKKGLWVSEFRIESGLNCGGHAFATDGLLMGPILDSFKTNRESLAAELYEICSRALAEKGKQGFLARPQQKITAQGGIGTAEEQAYLLECYGLDGTGWGSPFLLVPEATNVEDTTLHQLASATPADFYLSNASPLGVPFNNFRRSSSEAQRKERITKNRPGSPCYQNYLASNTEFTELPICTASRQYQHLKKKELESSGLAPEALEQAVNKLEEKDCLCEGLTASVRLKNGMYLPHKMSAVSICPGPNLAYFSGIFTLQEMVDHIYGRASITNSVPRPHMMLNELRIYVGYLKKQLEGSPKDEKEQKQLLKFRDNLLQGIAYYREALPDDGSGNKEKILREAAFELKELFCPATVAAL